MGRAPKSRRRHERRRPPFKELRSGLSWVVFGACVGGAKSKTRYPTRAEAKRAVRRIVGRKQDRPNMVTPGPLGEYLCLACGGWHIGHSPKNAARGGSGKSSGGGTGDGTSEGEG